MIAFIVSCTFFLFCHLPVFSTEFESKIQNESLIHYARAVHSQFGEEGIIDHIMRKIGVKRGFLVEFGGFDGIDMSNTRLLAKEGWSGAFIEYDKDLYAKMVKNFAAFPRIQCINEFVTPFQNEPEGMTIDAIADQYFPNREIDVMVIDIDGLDHLIFKNMEKQPKLIVIEGGIFWHPTMQLEVPDEIAARNAQQPICVMTKIANEKGYQLICATVNAFFIRNDFYYLFSQIDNDPSRIWWEALIHIRNFLPWFYKVIFEIRSEDWIQEWEAKDPTISFRLTEEYCNSILDEN